MLVTDPGIKASDAAAFRAAGMKILFGIPRSASTHTGRKHAETGGNANPNAKPRLCD
jgi:hypothetical protein